MTDVVSRLADVRRRIAEAAERSGRSADQIRLVAVTKSMDIDQTRALARAGCMDLGESRPQQLWAKADALADLPVRWHLIGHLQRNKVARTLRYVDLIHSVDSLRLLEALHATAEQQQITPRVLLEVNISGESAKHGFAEDELPAVCERAGDFSRVRIEGLMGMAGLEADLRETRDQFRRLRRLRDDLQQVCPPEVRLIELSMGMSRDFEIAIEEGATIVRVGSALVE